MILPICKRCQGKVENEMSEIIAAKNGHRKRGMVR
jgi:hypothetical protein